MNAYNKLNGTYLCENKEMLTDVLRREWGFDGYVMTDWGAMTHKLHQAQIQVPIPINEITEGLTSLVFYPKP